MNERDEAQFLQLHRNATKVEGYTVPWFLGIENLTRDHERYIYWRGVRVEHFDHDVWQQPGCRERMKEESVASHCRELETRGIVPNWKTIADWSG